MLLAKVTTAIAATAGFVQALTPPTHENPLLQWVAQLPHSKSTTGSVLIGQGPAGNGVSVQASFAGLPTEGGPFLYHIHQKPIGPDGNCTAAGGHLSPYSSQYPCQDPNHPEDCEAGDLSGKHGKITGTTFSANYIEDYVSNRNEAGCLQCMTDRSIVVHFANKTAITCANFTLNGSTSSATITTVPQSPASGSMTTIVPHSSAGGSMITITLHPSSSSGPPPKTTAPASGQADSGRQPAVATLAAALGGIAAMLI